MAVCQEITMTKLTKSIRGAITHDVLKHRFQDQALKLKGQHSKLAHRVYKDILGASNLKKMKTIPKGWLPTTNRIKVRAGEIFDLYLSGRMPGNNFNTYTETIVDGYLPIPQSMEGNYKCLKIYAPNTSIGLAISNHRKDIDSLTTVVNESAAEVRSMLTSCTTIKKLVAIWPEVEPFTLKHLSNGATPMHLPIKSVDSLNKLLDLPVKKERKKKKQNVV